MNYYTDKFGSHGDFGREKIRISVCHVIFHYIYIVFAKAIIIR